MFSLQFFPFICDWAGSSSPHGLLSSRRERGLLSSCGVWASHCGGFSRFGVWAAGCMGSKSCGSGALGRGLSIVAHGRRCPSACGIFPDQGSNPSLIPDQGSKALTSRFFPNEPPGKAPKGAFFLQSVCCCGSVASAVSDSVRPHGRQPTRLPCP